ncbi:MAG: adenylate/guanylate cyclase domain-containing protein, partial [Actinomycetes bacterium]
MGDMSADAVTYLPASLVRAAAAHPARELPWCDEVDGTMVMADLSGFTNLSERLGKLGDEGAERLTGTINSFFERMLDTACGYGGDTLTFGGDAILLLFDGEDHASRAVTAGLAMLKQTGRAAAIDAGDGKVKIGMSVGAHSGTFLLAGAGLADERAHLFVLGRGAETTALAESAAERGQMAVSAATKKLLPGGSRLGRAGEFWRVDELTNGRARLIAPGCERPASAGPPGADESGRQLAPFLPPYARMATVEGSERVTLTPEHRRVSIVFINILGLNELIDEQGSDAAVDQLQAYATMVARLSTRHHGFVVSTDIATRGSKLIVTFGAPVAHEYAAANAARFALDLCAELRASGLDVQH